MNDLGAMVATWLLSKENPIADPRQGWRKAKENDQAHCTQLEQFGMGTNKVV